MHRTRFRVCVKTGGAALSVAVSRLQERVEAGDAAPGLVALERHLCVTQWWQAAAMVPSV